MKVLLFNGSNREHGCTFTALSEAAEALNKEGIETEILQTGAAPVSDCIGCGGCSAGKNRCVIEGDSINSWIEKSKTADGFVFGTPVYFAHPSGRLLSVLDRMFYAAREVFEHKPAAGGAAAAPVEEKTEFDVVLKEIGASKLNVIKVVRELTGLGLVEAKNMVESAPSTIKEAQPKELADQMVAKLKEAGAVAELK